VKLTYLGTACVLLDYGGLRLLTDPAFDPAGRET
jgi:L-ascorbate metabolism protein UlaG (beta-lactamase superfamily)